MMSRSMAERDENVIYVRFGDEGGVVAPPPISAPELPPVPQGEVGDSDPLSNLYSTAEVSKLFEISESKLRYWARSELLSPSATRGRRRYYTFQDLVGVRAARDLLDAGISAREVRRSVDAIRKTLPKVARPLSELRVVAEGRAVLVRDEDRTFNPATGQFVLDFEVREIRETVVRELQIPDHKKNRRAAIQLYLEGCRLDEDGATDEEAERCYREALELDPKLASAMTNLGNLLHRRGELVEAEALYRQALELDPAQPEGFYNLGYLYAEQGEFQDACRHFRACLKIDDGFADAHFHLASALEERGRVRLAAKHWRAFLRLNPMSEWASLARQRLAHDASGSSERQNG